MEDPSQSLTLFIMCIQGLLLICGTMADHVEHHVDDGETYASLSEIM